VCVCVCVYVYKEFLVFCMGSVIRFFTVQKCQRVATGSQSHLNHRDKHEHTHTHTNACDPTVSDSMRKN